MEVNKIEDKIINILRFRLEVSDKKLIKENNIIPLTGRMFQCTSLDMTYLFFELEKEFECTIDINQIKSYEFNTIRGISELISKIVN